MFGLITRLSVLVSVPLLSSLRKANAGDAYQTAVSQYSNEIILILCLIMMVAGCLASVVTPDPDGVKASSPLAKFVYSIFASLVAMMYLAFYEKELTLVHAAWIGGVSFVAPAVVPSAKALVFELLPIAMKTVKDRFRKWIGADEKGND